MCEYCEGRNVLFESFGLELSVCNPNVVGHPVIDIKTGRNHLFININYCPNCGRKLKEAYDGND